MGKHTEDMPKDVKVVWGMGICIGIGATVVVLLIPLAILLIAFPQLWVVIAFLLIVVIGGYISARKR